MLEIKGENLQYIYQNNERKGVIMDIYTFEVVMRGWKITKTPWILNC
jgi:hypothetical protein